MVMILPVVTFSPYGSKAPDPVKASASVGTSTGADSWDVTTGAQKKEMLMGILWWLNIYIIHIYIYIIYDWEWMIYIDDDLLSN